MLIIINKLAYPIPFISKAILTAKRQYVRAATCILRTRNSCTEIEQTWRSQKMQISPAIVNGFENGFHQWIQRIFLVVVEVEKIGFRKIFFKSWIHFAAL